MFVGGGYAGIEALAELEDMARSACDQLGDLDPQNLRFLLVEAMDRILPGIDDDLAARAGDILRERGVDVRLETTLDAYGDGVATLSTGETFPADTVVWNTGVRPHPLCEELGLETDRGATSRRTASCAPAAGGCGRAVTAPRCPTPSRTA